MSCPPQISSVARLAVTVLNVPLQNSTRGQTPRTNPNQDVMFVSCGLIGHVNLKQSSQTLAETSRELLVFGGPD